MRRSILTMALARCCAAGCEARAAGGDASRPPPPECTPASLAAACGWYMYGQQCAVPCALPPDCSYEVRVDWGWRHCCFGEDVYVDCRCVGGTSLCRPAGAGSWMERGVPTSYCEWGCDGLDAGTGPPAEVDASIEDAAVEEDAGARDASADGAR